MKSIFAVALGLALMAGPSFAQNFGAAVPGIDAASLTPPDRGPGGSGRQPDGKEREAGDVKEAPLSQGGLAALMIMGAMAGLLVVQRQRQRS